jgi:hypothetical protein
MDTVTEPTLEEFFASEAGVCVYVNVNGSAIRVWFVAPDAPGCVASELPGAAEALALAKAALQKHQAKLAPLFEKIAIERAERGP